jgi:threonine dehydrogenase-like Zn-dependent dehydrogenase
MVYPAPGEVELEPFSLMDEAHDFIESYVTAPSTGTDLARCRGQLPDTTFPWYPGYSGVGKLVIRREERDGLKTGQRVYAHLRHASHQPIPSNGIVLPVPDEVSNAAAALTTHAAVALYGIRKAGITSGEPVVVIGDGVIGQLALWFAHYLGCSEPILIARHAKRRDIAQRFVPAATALDGKRASDVEDAVRLLTDGEGAAAVVDVTASASGFLTALRCARTQGRVVLLGSKVENVPDLPVQELICRKELHVMGAHQPNNPPAAQRADRQLILRLMAKGMLDVMPLITTVCPWWKGARLYRELLKNKEDHLGIVLDWTATSPEHDTA